MTNLKVLFLRIQLDSHAEDVLHLPFGPHSLLRMTLDIIIQRIYDFDIDILPRHLKQLIELRRGQFENYNEDSEFASISDHFDREMLHDGI